MVSERMRRPTNLSMAACSSVLLLVNSCEASVRPLVWTTAATSFAPMYLSTNSFADFFTCAVRIAATSWSSRTMTYKRPANGCLLDCVSFDTLRSAERKRVVRLDRNLHIRERVDLLQFAVLEHLEVLSREARDEVPLLVGDDHVDVDVVDLDLKGDRRGRGVPEGPVP